MLFVAEIGLNHDGNFDLAYELIRQAKLCGADIAKFQFGWRNRPDEINHIDLNRALQVKQWCDDLGIEMMASLITEEALELGRSAGLKRYKIASRTVRDNPALCERILSEGKETFVSLGMWEGEEFPFGPPTKKLRYIYCVSEYPTYPRDLNLPVCFGEDTHYGYSDHCHGIMACLLAVSRGALLIEKHFTLGKTSQVIRDHVMSATPNELRQIVDLGREMHLYL